MKEEKRRIPRLRFPEFTDDWEQRKLGDMVVDLYTGTNLIGSFIKKGIPLLKMGNIQRGYFDFNKLEYIQDVDSVNEKEYVKYGDFLFNTRNTLELVGKGATWFKESNGYIFNNNIAKVYFKRINTIFFNYLYNTDNILSQVKARAVGTTSVAAIYPKDWNTIKINIPIEEEQKNIGVLLQLMDESITLHQRKLDHLKLKKKSLLQKLFPKNGEKFPELRFPEFTDAWEQRKLGNIVFIGNGRDYKELNPGKIPVYGTGGYMLSVDKALCEKDAIGIGRKGTIDRPFILKAPFWTVDTLFYIVPNKDIDLDFLYALFQIINWKEKDESTGVPSLSKNIIKNISISIPSYDEQKEIGRYYHRVDKSITLHQRKLDHLKLKKKALLQQMFV